MSKYPAVKILLIVICGIILGYLFNFNFGTALIISFFSLVILFISFKYHFYKVAFVFACLSIGFSIASNVNWKDNIKPNKILQDFPAIVKGKVNKIIQEKDSYIKCIVEGEIDAKHLPLIRNTKAIVTIIKPEIENLKLTKGNRIIASGMAKFPDEALLPTDFNEYQYCNSNEADWIIRANSKNVSIDSEPSFFDKLLYNSTRYIKETIKDNHSVENSGIIIALTTGDKSEIPQETKHAFSLSGTAHVLAVSGLHVGIFSALVFLLLGFIRNKWIKFLFFSLIIILFIIFTGYQPSAQRAGFMAIVALFVHTRERRTEPLNLLCWVVLFLILLSPQLILKAGFQMSVASIAGIVLLYKPVKEKLSLFIRNEKGIVRFVLNSLALTISASVAVSPLVAYYFKVFSIISPLANLIVIPAITLAMIFALIGLAFSPLFPFITSIYASASDLFTSLAKGTCELSASIPYFYLENNSSFLISIFISFFIIYFITAKSKKQFGFRAVVGIIILILSILIFYPEEEKKIEIIPRKQLTAVIIPSETKGTFILLADRKPSQYPYNDYGLTKYLLTLNTNLTIGYTGNASIAIVDNLKSAKKIRYQHIPLEIQDKIVKLLKINEKLPKLISYK